MLEKWRGLRLKNKSDLSLEVQLEFLLEGLLELPLVLLMKKRKR
jgi:hypothetical protein